jgi:hypothetical protein
LYSRSRYTLEWRRILRVSSSCAKRQETRHSFGWPPRPTNFGPDTGVESWLEVVAVSAGIPSRFRLRVDSEMAYRARWVLEESDVTERELTYLATGELEPDDDG